MALDDFNREMKKKAEKMAEDLKDKVEKLIPKKPPSVKGSRDWLKILSGDTSSMSDNAKMEQTKLIFKALGDETGRKFTGFKLSDISGNSNAISNVNEYARNQMKEISTKVIEEDQRNREKKYKEESERIENANKFGSVKSLVKKLGGNSRELLGIDLDDIKGKGELLDGALKRLCDIIDENANAMKQNAQTNQGAADEASKGTFNDWRRGNKAKAMEANNENQRRANNLINAANRRGQLANRIFDKDGKLKMSANKSDIQEFKEISEYMELAEQGGMTEEMKSESRKKMKNLERLVLDRDGKIRMSANKRQVQEYLANKEMLEKQKQAEKQAKDLEEAKKMALLNSEKSLKQILQLLKDGGL